MDNQQREMGTMLELAVEQAQKDAKGWLDSGVKGPTEGLTDTQELIVAVCDETKEFLLGKNRAYGDSAINPVRIFSSSDPMEQINVRIDDKLSRFMRGNSYPGDNDEKDLLGYLLLKEVVRRKLKGEACGGGS